MSNQLSSAEQLLADLDRMGISVVLADDGLALAGEARDVPSDLYASLWRHVDAVARLLQKRPCTGVPRPARTFSFVRAGKRLHGIFPLASEEAEDVLRRKLGEVSDVKMCTRRPKRAAPIVWMGQHGGGTAA